MKYKLTYHAVERLQERFPKFTSEIHEIYHWRRNQGLSCVKWIFDQMLNDCKENKSYLNNTENMMKLYEKYGFDSDYKFMELNNNILFLLTKNRSEDFYSLVTVMPSSFRPLVKNIKYKNKNNEYDQNIIEVNTESDYKIPSEVDYMIMKDKLIELVSNKQATEIEQISKTKTKYTAISNNQEYEFIYTENKLKERNVEILKIYSIKNNTTNKLKK